VGPFGRSLGHEGVALRGLWDPNPSSLLLPGCKVSSLLHHTILPLPSLTCDRGPKQGGNLILDWAQHCELSSQWAFIFINNYQRNFRVTENWLTQYQILYIQWFFSYTYIKFHFKIRYSKRLTITHNKIEELQQYPVIKIMKCGLS
jgi:hypothetical protein